MAQQTTRLTQQDLKIYPSERLTDTDDGGGLMRGTPLTGIDNELFTPVSDVDRVMGAFDARLVYPGVLRNDAEPLYGAYFVISEPPKADNVSYLAFKASKYGEIRKEIMPRIEAYSVPTIESRMVLLGRQLAGSRIVQAYQRVEAPLPIVGERYCLSFEETGKDAVQEYFRILNVSSEVRTFEDPEGKEFQRSVIKIETSNALTRDFKGVDYPSNKGYAKPPTKILETQVADSAKYFGCKPLAEDINANDTSVRVTEIFEKIVPTSMVETPLIDQFPSKAACWLATSPKQAVFQASGNRAAGDLYLAQSVLPGSVELLNYKDDAQGQLIDGDKVLTIDYENAVIRGVPSLNSPVIQAVPASKISNSSCSSIIEINDTNQGTEWAPFLVPKPVNGSLSVAWMSQGTWYELLDHGDYNLRDKEGKIRGLVSRTGSVVISLPEQPDVGSKVIITWAPTEFYKTIDDKDNGNTIVPQTISPEIALLQINQPIIKPGTVSLNFGGAVTTDNGKGVLTGGVSGRVDYANGQIYLSAGSAVSSANVQFDYYADETIKTPLTLDATSTHITGVIGTSIAGTVKIVADLYYHEDVRLWYAVGPLFGMSSGQSNIDVSERNLFVFTDNGNGQLVLNNKLVTGSSIDYATGLFNVPFESIKGDCIRPSWQKIQTGIDSAIGGQGNNDFAMYDIKERNVYPQVGTGSYCFKLKTTAVQHYAKDHTGSYFKVNVLSGKAQPVQCIPNSFVFDVAGTKIYERQGRLYRNINNTNGNGEEVGTLSSFGDLSITNPNLVLGNITIVSGIYATGGLLGKQAYGYTTAAPVKPKSFTAYANGAGGVLVGTAGENGAITGDINGTIETKTGFYQLSSDKGFSPESLRYNTVVQSNIPLDSSIIGIDAVRLPPDGRVPIFRRGDMIVITNKSTQNLGTAFTANQIVNVGRADIDRVAIIDSQNKQVDANKYEVDLEAGTITWLEPLDLSAYAMPLQALSMIEEENRVVDVDINGRLKLQFPTARTYPTSNTYVSSALIGGDMLVRSTPPFSQKSWTNVWKDERIGDEILAKLNVKDYPITLISAGAVTERWLLRFSSATQFSLVGENLGLLLQSDTLTDLAPVNPSTGKPYFTLPRTAFGGGWESGNCVRFNTFGTPMPTWILRAIQPSSTPQTEKDGFTGCLRGNTVDL